MGAIYAGEPVPRPAPDTRDELVQVAPVHGGNVTSSPGSMDEPIPSLPYHRAPFGVAMDLDVQDLDLGMEIPQASAGRPIIPARLQFPEQSMTPEPDRRRIARPMPTAARDADEVIR